MIGGLSEASASRVASFAAKVLGTRRKYMAPFKDQPA